MSTSEQKTPNLQERIYSLAFKLFRNRGRKLSHQNLPFETCEKLLDIGGDPQFWKEWRVKAKITCLHVDKIEPEAGRSLYELLPADGCATGLPDLSYDTCFSNSVIEYVSGHSKLSTVAPEVSRLAPAYWVKAPNRCFFFATHVLGPFMHWPGKGRLSRITCRYLSIWVLRNRRSNDELFAFLGASTHSTIGNCKHFFQTQKLSEKNSFL